MRSLTVPAAPTVRARLLRTARAGRWGFTPLPLRVSIPGAGTVTGSFVGPLPPVALQLAEAERVGGRRLRDQEAVVDVKPAGLAQPADRAVAAAAAVEQVGPAKGRSGD